MKGKRFNEIKKDVPKKGKHILVLTLCLFGAIVIGYFIFVGVRK